ncbi:MAG: lipocalin family protein [Paludibacteraceae bacterium]|nr:lipocalin family protein [Paludibacteraceae bacterium]
MRKLLYFVAVIMVTLAFAGCKDGDENAFSGELEGEWRVISVSGYEIIGSTRTETKTTSIEDKFNYWLFSADGNFELFYVKEDGQKKTECAGTWKRNDAKLDMKVNNAGDVKVEGTIMQLTASKLVFEMKQSSGELRIIEVYNCKRE